MNSDEDEIGSSDEYELRESDDDEGDEENEDKIHIGKSFCLLCRQQPEPGSAILDLNNHLFTAPDCDSDCDVCLDCDPIPGVWYHRACFDIFKPSYGRSDVPTEKEFRRLEDATTILDDLEHLDEPIQDVDSSEVATTMEGLLSRHARNLLQGTFRQDLLNRLPTELTLMIAERITPCWFLIVLGQTRRLMSLVRAGPGPGSERLNLQQDLWVSKVNYQGNSYLANLSTEPLSQSTETTQYRINLPHEVKTVVLSVDSVGIRGIQFTSSDSEASPDGSRRYRILEVKDPHCEIKVKRNAIFVTGIKLLPNNSSSGLRLWSSPVLPKFNPWNFYQEGMNGVLEHVQFDSELQGLLICCAGGRMLGIHGFSGKSKKFTEFIDSIIPSKYDEVTAWIHSPEKYWIYYPFSRNENIFGAWIRKKKGNAEAHPILVLQSSLGKTITFGPQIPPKESHHYQYHSLVREGDGAVTGIIHDGLEPGYEQILELGVTCNELHRTPAPVEPLMSSPLELPQTPSHARGPVPQWYLTSAPLEGVERVQVFRRSGNLSRHCLGLLLSYHDGRVEALGQVRWDQNTTEEGRIRLGVKLGWSPRGIKRVLDIRSGVTDCELVDHSGAGSWSLLPDQGILVWWFGEYGDILTVLDP
ncbi:hypothetical protein P170DRAFT_400433 [Aspergillus steynii IBT 23096]|uniref:Uncharacterized protein n=1 Tax=Aspergillus steynii IBT 23096 TaxID=1392250 RepID=A0A2I2GF60_9EURO|nr:uncharacterized protein P170DRAFT_400433 [Aspergillus steynii IBT 23096]PLB51523.1 hypothetical protein P170DRAFT_400433 [Aspergillus steynii IBT 23096]